jgi:hypothetical protein
VSKFAEVGDKVLVLRPEYVAGKIGVSRWAAKKSAMLRYINTENASTRWFVYGRTFKGIFDS